ncbi:D-lactate dehydrogenase cytochrome oxidoreductase [Lentinus tigrinus ALCF2SS1-7]|uniref:D-lactate dehydrogenase (cytochrome) n=1 Tax=Lentinus tigrinus ALCF2SS1-6 TaxID=1328759 RepID=A0A5C2SPZ4_9APHY|nr:D-lactate dehydrogenase cytochrome oxidoreductase [Lentinus tigrinus ALCF2SS1-6]RPD79807.1 D-lactate dehydrogenase cytochrome oxidoreductase [Lentinus tigrinus ALCF2SS1-7]
MYAGSVVNGTAAATRQVSRRASSRLWLQAVPRRRATTSAHTHLSPGERLSERAQRAALGAGLLVATSAVYYHLSRPIHLDGEAAFDGPRPKGSKVTTHEDVPLSPAHSKYATKVEVKKAIEELKKALPHEGAVVVDPHVLEMYGSSDKSYHPASPHSVVVRPASTEEVVAIVNIARKYRVPIVPYSGATSLEGHFSGYPSGSICLDMSAMNKILEIHEDDSDLICQAGKGIPLFFPLDPGPGATIGGMIGTGCSGTNAVRYGTARGEWFLNVTVVLPNGKVIKTRRRARKSSAGIDMTKLFIGAEGTLGIITEATLRLAPVIPTKVAMAQFPDVEHAVSAVQEILNTPAGPHIQCVELLDDRMMAAIDEAGLVSETLPIRDTLFFKIQGDPAAIESTARTVQQIVSNHGSSNFKFAKTDDEAEELWESRKYALMSTIESQEDARCWTTDVCVPVSRLPQLVYETKKDLAQSKLASTIVGHVGDGNFHAFILFKKDSELQAVSDAVHRLVHRAIDLDGTCTGEHGVGVGKKEYLIAELGEDTVELMWTIKNAIDPLDIMNPGKLYPDLPHDGEPSKGRH